MLLGRSPARATASATVMIAACSPAEIGVAVRRAPSGVTMRRVVMTVTALPVGG